jgi:AbrB family looped-hinge helix DNA binding protein
MIEEFKTQINKYKNRITIPKQIIDYMGLKPGDWVNVTIEKIDEK